MGIKDMPNIYKLTLCLWTKFPQPPKDDLNSVVVSYEPEGSQTQEVFLLWFAASKGRFTVNTKEKPDDE